MACFTVLNLIIMSYLAIYRTGEGCPLPNRPSATYGTRAKRGTARGTIFNGTLSELKCSNYYLIKELNF
jgi:hypothetical protein